MRQPQFSEPAPTMAMTGCDEDAPVSGIFVEVCKSMEKPYIRNVIYATLHQNQTYRSHQA